MKILAGDIGGTNCRLGLWADGALSHLSLSSSRAGDSPLPTLTAWLDTYARAPGTAPDALCLAVAGPVQGGVCVGTNFPWRVDGPALSAALGLPVFVVNDFYAAARAISLLGPDDQVTLVPGTADPSAPAFVLGAGTGLGEAYVVGDRVLPGEGGHASFGPRTVEDAQLAAWLISRLGRCRWEDLLSGAGLVRIAAFLAHQRGEGLAWEQEDDAPARVVAEVPEAVAWFARLYAQEAANGALRLLARGGVYLCGGIAPRVLPALSAAFPEVFPDQGPISGVLAGVPVVAVTHPQPGLLGAAAAGLHAMAAR